MQQMADDVVRVLPETTVRRTAASLPTSGLSVKNIKMKH
jgi:hypothetical protein